MTRLLQALWMDSKASPAGAASLVFAVLVIAIAIVTSVAMAGGGAMTGATTGAPAGTAAEVTTAAGAQSPEVLSSPLYTWLDHHRGAAYWLAPMLMIVVAILPIPAEIPAAMNGMLFGAIIGVVMTWGGAVIGALISYELARCFGLTLSRRFVSPEMTRKLEGLEVTEAPVMLMLRLMPFVAFTVVNWGSGLLQVRRTTFLWTTAVGILPGAIAFTASGSVIGWLYTVHPAAVGAVAAAVAALFIVRAFRKRRLATAGEEPVAG